ncbi:MAG: putative quinol monooxygenase [Caldimonas sp.]
MILVTGTLQSRADSIDSLRALAIEHVVRSRTEAGCIEHGVAVDATDSLRLVFFERWADRAALDAHFKVPASRAFVAQAIGLAAQPPRISVYEAEEIALS